MAITISVSMQWIDKAGACPFLQIAPAGQYRREDWEWQYGTVAPGCGRNDGTVSASPSSRRPWELLPADRRTCCCGTSTTLGKRPSFDAAAPPEQARELYEYCVEKIRAAGLRCKTGRFQETMQVELVNEGPVTILLDSAKMF